MAADVAMPLRRRWGAADGPEARGGACLPHAYEGSFDGVAPRRAADAGGLWAASSWFAAGADVAAARAREDENAALPCGGEAEPGGARSQNRLSRGAVQVQPFRPLSSTQALQEARLDAGEAQTPWSAAPAFSLCGANASEVASSAGLFRTNGAAGGRTCAAEAAPCGFMYSFERRRWETAAEGGGDAVRPAPAAAAATSTPPDAAGGKRARDAAPQAAGAAADDVPAVSAVEALRALRLRRHALAAPAASEPARRVAAALPAAAAPLRKCAAPHATPALAARRAHAAAAPPDSAAASEAVCWSQFRLSCGRLVYVRAEAVTPQMAAGWARDAASFPPVHVLETSAAARAAAALPACAPGPRADAALEARVREEVAAWAATMTAAAEPVDGISANSSAEISAASAAAEGGAGAQQALVQSLFRGARQAEAAAAAARDAELNAAREYVQRLEAALARAGIPLPPRP